MLSRVPRTGHEVSVLLVCVALSLARQRRCGAAAGAGAGGRQRRRHHTEQPGRRLDEPAETRGGARALRGGRVGRRLAGGRAGEPGDRDDGAAALRTGAADARRRREGRRADVRAWYNLGLLARTLGDSDAALAAFTRATELRPTTRTRTTSRASSAARSSSTTRPSPSFTRALELDPFLVSAEFGLARAYQRSGKAEDAKTHMDRFTRLTQEKVASAMSLVLRRPGAAVAGPGGAAAGRRGAGRDSGEVRGAEDRSRLRPRPSPYVRGICLIDADGDGALDYVRLDARARAVMRNDGKGQFAESQSLAAATPRCLRRGDYDNDEKPDIAWPGARRRAVPQRRRRRLQPRRRHVLRTAPATAGRQPRGRRSRRGPGSSIVGLHGDAASGRPRATPRSTGTTATARLPTSRPSAGCRSRTRGITASDLNNDRAIDLVFTGRRSTVVINPREGAFRPLDAFAPSAPRTRGASPRSTSTRTAGWTWPSRIGARRLSLWRNVEGAAFEQVTLPAPGMTNGCGLTVIDYDNDGWLDLAATGAGRRAASCSVLRNVEGRFEDASTAVARRRGSAGAPRGLSPAISTATTTAICRRRPATGLRSSCATTAATRTTPCASRWPASTTTAAASARRSKCRPARCGRSSRP